jgi:HJR/Mrr/RecB family endonuclease
LAGPDIIPIRSGIDFCEFRKQVNMNIGAADLLNILIMSEKIKKCLKIVVKIFGIYHIWLYL